MSVVAQFEQTMIANPGASPNYFSPPGPGTLKLAKSAPQALRPARNGQRQAPSEVYLKQKIASRHLDDQPLGEANSRVVTGGLMR